MLDRFKREFANEIELLEMKQKTVVQQQEKKRVSIEDQGTAKKQKQDQERYNAYYFIDVGFCEIYTLITIKHRWIIGLQ